ncbi:MnhB domain-containing protein [Halarchaeum sp. P4]|uniref:MnhB domain-containing protein n=1 Tax=Halarchaeum sp. P4 TaxID=3421639 RepID=UPI003EBEE563
MSASDDDRRESIVVTRSVRLLVPFVLTLGLFTMFHGTASIGGGFQGGVVVGATVVTLAFAFGLDQVADWLPEADVLATATVGVFGFVLLGTGAVLLGAPFLDFGAYPLKKAHVYGVEAAELGIGVTVAATVIALLLAVAGHYGRPETGEESNGSEQRENREARDGGAH